MQVYQVRQSAQWQRFSVVTVLQGVARLGLTRGLCVTVGLGIAFGLCLGCESGAFNISASSLAFFVSAASLSALALYAAAFA